MLQSLRKSKNANEKRWLSHNILNNSRLQTSFISRVFATHFEVGGLHASYERHFVKKIQQQLSYHIVCHPKLESLMLTLHSVLGWFYKLALLDFELIFEVKMQEREGV